MKVVLVGTLFATDDGVRAPGEISARIEAEVVDGRVVGRVMDYGRPGAPVPFDLAAEELRWLLDPLRAALGFAPD